MLGKRTLYPIAGSDKREGCCVGAKTRLPTAKGREPI
jgi:hypothetical protein